MALARAIVINPRVLLLREPFAAPGKALRLDMQAELKRMQREVGITTVFVTDDQEEALTMADSIGLLKDGRLIEEGQPEEIYNRPKTLFAATFLGDANIFEGELQECGVMLTDGRTVSVADSTKLQSAKIRCAVRPEWIRIVSAHQLQLENVLEGRIESKLFAGDSTTLVVNQIGREIRVGLPNSGSMTLNDGEEVTLTWSRESTIPVAAA